MFTYKSCRKLVHIDVLSTFRSLSGFLKLHYQPQFCSNVIRLIPTHPEQMIIMFFCTWHVLINFSPIRLTRTLNLGSIPTPLCDNGTSFREVEIVARERFIFELACALIVLGRNFDICKKCFYQRTQNDPETNKY